jgi:pyrophosphatase PpaX
VIIIKAIIFDFDGTLANTLPICYYAFQKVFEVYDHKDLSKDEIKAMFGPSETGIIRENLTNINKDKAIELFYTIYSTNHQQLVKPNNEINKLIEYLKDKGMKLGIVTGKARRSLDISLNALQMDNLFDVIITGDDVTKPKPHPEGIIKALSLLGVKNTEAMFIGDSDADIQAGKQANVYPVGVQWLPEYQTLEFKVEPDSTFYSVTEFINFIKVGVTN